MRADWLRYLGAGSAVYIAMAACSADSGPPLASDGAAGTAAPGPTEAASGGMGRSSEATAGLTVAAGGAPGVRVEPNSPASAGTAGSLLTSLVEPVPTAAAAGAAGAGQTGVPPSITPPACDCPKPEVYEVPCDSRIATPYTDPDAAVLDLPGRMIASLAGITAIVRYDNQDGIDDYQAMTAGVFIRDEQVAVSCEGGDNGVATFVIPPE